MAPLCPQSAVACPTCKGALHNQAALGFAISILFMMLMPFVIIVVWTVAVIRFRRQATTAVVVKEYES
jgi:hypothetical protein